jgi:hypothetical protein
MAFFANFPKIDYNFGDEILPSKFQNLSIYIDLIDQLTDDAHFYENYTIIDGERADILSYKLYGTTDLYWTFYLLNEKLRSQGWPLTFQEIYESRSLYYPHKVFKTTDTFFDRMYLGDTVIQGSLSSPTAIGSVVKKDYDTGQLFIKVETELRSITVTNGGSGYTSSPTITILDDQGNSNNSSIVNATASATIIDGVVTAINVIKGGSGYKTAPTIQISEPQVIDWEAVAEKIELMIKGRSEVYNTILTTLYPTTETNNASQFEVLNYLTWEEALKIYTYEIGNEVPAYVSDDYTDLLTDIFNGFKRGDISKRGEITQDDANIIRSFAINPDNINPDYKRRIIDGLKRPILNNADSYPLWVPYGGTGTKAVGTAVLSNSNFSAGTIASQNGIADWRNFDQSLIRSINASSVVDQFNAIHHYEDSSGNHVDINPTISGSGSLYTPITYFDRLESQNEDLKIIKVLKEDVAQQIYSEYQRLLRDNNVN